MPITNPKALATLYWSLVVTIALAAMLMIATFWLGTEVQADNELAGHTLAVRNQIAQVATLVQDAESGQRGYLLTGTDIYLTLYDAAVAALPAVLNEIAAMVPDDPQQQEALIRLRLLVTQKLREERSTIDEYKAGHAETALAIVKTNYGRLTMIDIRRLLSAMETEENRRLSIRHDGAATSVILLEIGAMIAFVLIGAVGAVVGRYTRRWFLALSAGSDRLAVANEALSEQVSRREQVECQFRQSQKMEAIGQLTGGIAHDFNNMLGVIIGSLDLMQRRIKKGDFGIERFLEAALKAADRAAVLTDRMLAFARQQPLAPEPIDVNRMMANTSDLLRSTLGEQIRIETVSAAGLWITKADAYQLENAILNIAINARDAMPDGGKLTIETANACLDDAYCREHAEVEPGQFVMIAISDNGIGMKPQDVQRAFDPFFTTKPVGKGTGLGLSQVFGFVKQSRGHVKIYSEIGAGTTVKIYMPRLVGVVEEVKQAPLQPAQAGDGEIILVVEDEPSMLRLTTDALRELGYKVLDNDTAAGALADLARVPEIKLLFTDVVMPDVNGRELAEEASRLRPDLKVLFTTGYAPNAVVHDGTLDPGVNMLGKPFTIEQLSSKVREVLNECRRQPPGSTASS